MKQGQTSVSSPHHSSPNVSQHVRMKRGIWANELTPQSGWLYKVQVLSLVRPVGWCMCHPQCLSGRASRSHWTINVHSEMLVSALDYGVGSIIWRVARICTQHRVEWTHGWQL